MRLETSLYQRPELRLKLAPQIIQSIEILQLPMLKLQELVSQEMLQNPTIELLEERPDDQDSSESGERTDGDGGERSEAERTTDTGEGSSSDAPDGAPAESEGEAAEPDGGPSAEELEAEFARLDGLEPVWTEGFGSRGQGGGGEDGEDKKLEALQNTAARRDSLQEHVFAQFSLVVEDERQRTIGEHLIFSLDDATGWLGYRQDGQFVPYSLEDLCASLDDPCTVAEAERVLRIIQRLEPQGIGARDLTECLLLQLPEGASLERILIERHLDDIKKNRLPKVAKETGRDIEEIKEAVAFISCLNPHPGSLYGGADASHITPDVIVDLVDGQYIVRLEDTYLPRIQVSPRYRLMLQEQKDDRAVRDYIKKKIDAAKWLIDSIEQRQNTLRKISTEIVEYQKPFLDRGIDALRPLKMQDIADKVGVHVSTVSRAISDKYMQTPRGVFPLKFFFNGGTTNAEGDEESILAVKQKVRDIVANEDKQGPLSDEDIAKELSRMGYDIARRTVTKYRKQLGILSSRQRREF